MRARWLLLSFLAFTVVAEGRSSKALPLMPDREQEALMLLEEPTDAPPRKKYEAPAEVPPLRYAYQAKRHQSRSPDYALSASGGQERRGSLLMGLELGAVGRGSSTSADALGLKLMWGGRAFAIVPMGKRIYLKPSLGFFYRRETSAKVGISEHVAEGGLNLQYSFSQGSGVNWFVGAVSRFDVAFSRTSISTLEANPTSSGTSESSAPLFRYRFGPSLGLTYRMTPEVGLLLDAEVTFSFTKPVKPFGGLVGGLIFRL